MMMIVEQQFFLSTTKSCHSYRMYSTMSGCVAFWSTEATIAAVQPGFSLYVWFIKTSCCCSSETATKTLATPRIHNCDRYVVKY